MRLNGKPNYKRLAITVAAIFALAALGVYMMVRMPGASHKGALPPFTENEQKLAADLRAHVTHLALEVGPRSLATFDAVGATARYKEQGEALDQAARYIEAALEGMGYKPLSQELRGYEHTVRNIEVEIPGAARPDEILIIGAHYDTVPGTPGADDNASAVAALLELARAFKGETPPITLRFVFFTNEEPPFFMTPDMGSYQYAMRSKERGENITGMLCLESIGYYSDEPGSQFFPPPLGLFYPDTGNFLAFVGNWKSRKLLYKSIRTFRDTTAFPSEGLVAPIAITGTDWSDHWSFWQAGYKAIMITDTAIFRNPFYHTSLDLPDRLDYERLARVAGGIENTVKAIFD